MIVEFDTNKFCSVRAKDKNGEWFRIEGKCLRCGKCGCETCDHFTHEIVDDKRIGKCKRQFEKPFLCALYPYDPHDKLKEGCGFKWIKE